MDVLWVVLWISAMRKDAAPLLWPARKLRALAASVVLYSALLACHSDVVRRTRSRSARQALHSDCHPISPLFSRFGLNLSTANQSLHLEQQRLGRASCIIDPEDCVCVCVSQGGGSRANSVQVIAWCSE